MDEESIEDMSGAWKIDIEIPADAQRVVVMFDYRIILPEAADDEYFADVIVLLDGILFEGVSGSCIVATVSGESFNVGDIDTGFVPFTSEAISLPAGTNELVLGGFLNLKDSVVEKAYIQCEVFVDSTPSPTADELPGPTPSPTLAPTSGPTDWPTPGPLLGPTPAPCLRLFLSSDRCCPRTRSSTLSTLRRLTSPFCTWATCSTRARRTTQRAALFCRVVTAS